MAPLARRRGILAVGTALVLTLSIVTLDRGGFTAGSQRLLLIMCSIAIAAACALEPDRLARGLASPVVWSLLALGGVTILSATWTIGSGAAAVRWGLVIVGYASLVVVGQLVAERFGVWPVAACLAVIAATEALLGLGAAVAHDSPQALYLNGSWRPAGTFEYPPALGLLQVCALPVGWRATASPVPAFRALGALSIALAGIVLGAIDSRMDLALAAVTLLALGLWADTTRSGRRRVAAAVGALAAGIVVGALLIGRRAGPGAAHDAAITALGLGVACVAIVAAWPALVRLAGRLNVRRAVVGAAGVAVAAAAIWLLAGYASTLTTFGGGVSHGRISYWKAAFDAWERRPILGFGAQTYFRAAAAFQAANDPTVFAHDLPLEVAVELGIPGLVAALSLYATTARLLWRSAQAPDAWLLAPTVACFLIANLVDWPWHLAALGALWAVAAGTLAHLAATAPGSSRRSNADA